MPPSTHEGADGASDVGAKPNRSQGGDIASRMEAVFSGGGDGEGEDRDAVDRDEPSDRRRKSTPSDDTTDDDDRGSIDDEGDEDDGSPDDVDDGRGERRAKGEKDDESDDDDDDAGAGDGSTPLSLEGLAKQIDVPLEQLLDGLQHTFSVDGEELTLPLSELVRGHQRERTFHQRVQEVEKQRGELSKAQTDIATDYQGKLEQLGKMLHIAEQALVQDMDTPSMHALRASSPSEWSARVTEIQQRQAKIKQLFEGVVQEYRQQQEGVTKQQVEDFQRRRTEEMTKLLAAIPQWDDGYKAKIITYGKKIGFSDAELTDIVDHRLLVMADKARRYDEMVDGKGKRKLKPKPKPRSDSDKQTLNPRRGQRQERGTRGDREFREARSKLKKSGKLQDAAAVFDSRFGA